MSESISHGHIQPPRPQTPHGPAKVAGVPSASANRVEELDLDPISLVDDPVGVDAPSPTSKIKAFGVAGTAAAHSYKRQPVVTGQGACRVRTFHGRLSDEGMGFMDEKINDWLDQHPEIEIKLVTTTIGTYEGKIREPALVVNVWY